MIHSFVYKFCKLYEMLIFQMVPLDLLESKYEILVISSNQIINSELMSPKMFVQIYFDDNKNNTNYLEAEN